MNLNEWFIINVGIFAFQIQIDSNGLTELASNTFSGLSNLTMVNLTDNKLEKFSINSLAVTIAAVGGGGEEDQDEGEFAKFTATTHSAFPGIIKLSAAAAADLGFSVQPFKLFFSTW